MSYPFADEHEPPPITPAVKWLIAINVAVFFVQLTVLDEAFVRNSLGFQLIDLQSGRWWTIGTYMFVHAGLLHIAVNLYTLWMFGRRVEHVWSPGAFTRFYLWCGLGGWLFHLLFVRDGVLLGASAAVFGVMLAYAMRWPDDEVFLFGILPMKVKWLVTALVVFNLVMGIGTAGSGGGTAYLAHIGGLAFAWLYLRTPSAQSIERLKQRVSQLPDVQDETPRAIPRSSPRQRERERGSEVDEIVAKSKAIVTKRPAAARPAPSKKRDGRVEELNLVLDKISQQGLDSLTSEERKLLEEMSRELRNG
jgi:membrane associated rhomboid family serine protease